ncbi:MAG: SpoIIE family protein phosphatase [Clostridia bacterium]|nr:SpoIIE family protein phosphatase [Clostridia bacterium]
MEELIKRLKSGVKRDGAAYFSGALGAVSAALPSAAVLLTGALLASYSPFEGISPFGIAVVIAAWYAGADPYSAAVGAALGYSLTRGFAYAAAALALGAVIYLVTNKRSVERIFRPLIAFAAETAALLLAAPLFRLRALLLMGSAAVSVFAGMVLGLGMRALRQLLCGRSPGDAELLTLSASAGLIVLAMRSFSVLGQSPAMILAGACALFAAYRLGFSAAGAAVTIGAGRILATGGDMHFIAVLAAGAMIAASVRALGKWASLVCFAGLNLIFFAFMGGVGVFSPFETACVCMIFAAVPARLYMPKAANGRPEGADARYGELQFRVASISDVLAELARVAEGSDGMLLGCVSAALRRSLNRSRAESRSAFEAEYGAAGSVKKGSVKSGDSYSVLDIDGKLLLALSDGMGSGEAASDESRAALALLSDLLSVGFGVDEATECVNGMLRRSGDPDMYATLDVMLIDLNDGVAEMKKHGAPSSYVLRGGRVFTLYSEALPVGILDAASGSARSVRLKSGDTVIMMSDGVTEALGSGLIAAITDNVLGWGDPELAAKSLLDEALRRGREDDMTVLLARIEERAA